MTKTNAKPSLRLTPYAWAKLLRLRDLGPTEVGGFGISAIDDLLLIEDVCLVKQLCTSVTVKFDDESVADYFDTYVDLGLTPERIGRIWIHTHPGESPQPSGIDEETFARCFGSADWAVMFIVARGGKTYAQLRFNTGPGGALELPVEVDFTQPFAASEWAGWDEEYRQCVAPEVTIADRRQTMEEYVVRMQQRALQEDEYINGWAADPFEDVPFVDDYPFHPFLEAFDERVR